MSNVDEAEAVQSTVVARGSRSAPAPGPSHPLPSMSRVSDSDRRPAMHVNILALHKCYIDLDLWLLFTISMYAVTVRV